MNYIELAHKQFTDMTTNATTLPFVVTLAVALVPYIWYKRYVCSIEINSF